VSDMSSFSSTQCHDAVEGSLVAYSAYHKRLEHIDRDLHETETLTSRDRDETETLALPAETRRF